MSLSEFSNKMLGQETRKLHFVHYHGLLQVLFHLQGVYSVALGRTILVSGGEDSKVKKYFVKFNRHGFIFFIKCNLFIYQIFFLSKVFQFQLLHMSRCMVI